MNHWRIVEGYGRFDGLTAHPMEDHYDTGNICKFALGDRMNGSQGPCVVSQVFRLIVQTLKFGLDGLAPELCYRKIRVYGLGRLEAIGYDNL